MPDSLVVLGSDTITNMSIKQAGDLGRSLPNIGFKQDLSVTSSFISVRGITSTRNTDPAVSLVIDGVQAASASQIRQQLFDIEQMEVLKGPQGSLYGRKPSPRDQRRNQEAHQHAGRTRRVRFRQRGLYGRQRVDFRADHR